MGAFRVDLERAGAAFLDLEALEGMSTGCSGKIKDDEAIDHGNNKKRRNRRAGCVAFGAYCLDRIRETPRLQGASAYAPPLLLRAPLLIVGALRIVFTIAACLLDCLGRATHPSFSKSP